MFFFVFPPPDLTPQGSSGINHPNEAVLCASEVSLQRKFCKKKGKLNTSRHYSAEAAERRAVCFPVSEAATSSPVL